jgi:hypothetical protein
MSTRAVYTFKGFGETYHVYKHHDGYPTGAAEFLSKAVEAAWPAPRYEPDEFAAAFVAANRTSPGGVRLTASRMQAKDVEYGYTVYPLDNKTRAKFPQLKAGALLVEVVSTNYWDGKRDERLIFRGPLMEFICNAEALEDQWNAA